ncbi:fumarylacetoacetate hydrolase family protein [Palleronia marisminoris]|uniref:fumarylacetoacetate hydrolase family protein n=1 Tax=Palleronia marisminoris TaxID=315423 RepID=UPI0035216615
MAQRDNTAREAVASRTRPLPRAGLPYLVSYLSTFMTLEPGDVVTNGTPPGVGPGCGRRSSFGKVRSWASKSTGWEFRSRNAYEERQGDGPRRYRGLRLHRHRGRLGRVRAGEPAERGSR